MMMLKFFSFHPYSTRKSRNVTGFVRIIIAIFAFEKIGFMVDVDFAEMITLILDEEMDIGSRDDALYRVLTESLRLRLLRRFRPYEKVAPFAFEDALQEFFLYLRGEGSNAYSIFRELKDASAADAWLITTFRNFVSKKSRYGVRAVAMDIPDLSDCPSREQDEQQKALSTMIAYCYQEFPLVQRFVFLGSSTKRNRGEEFEPGGFADCF